MKKVILPDNSGVRFEFDGLASYTLLTRDMAEVNQDRMACAGISQRIGDNAAITKGPENGYKVTESMRRAAVVELGDFYKSGSEDWSPKSKAPRETFNPHIQAIAEKRNCSYAMAQAWFTEKLLAELADDAPFVIDVKSREVGGQLAIAG